MCKASVVSARTTRTVIKSGVKFVIKREGSLDCEVRFRLARGLFKKFMQYYGKNHNWFQTCEVYQQSAGWYAAFCRNDVVSGAMRIMDLLSVAIQHGFQRATSTVVQCATLSSLGLKKKVLFRVKKVNMRGHLRPVAVSLAVQAARNQQTSRLSLVDLELKEQFARMVATRSGMEALQQKFARA